MDSEEAAFASAKQKHNKYMVFGKKNRYIEVFQCSGDDMNLVLNGGAIHSPNQRKSPPLISGMLQAQQQPSQSTQSINNYDLIRHTNALLRTPSTNALLVQQQAQLIAQQNLLAARHQAAAAAAAAQQSSELSGIARSDITTLTRHDMRPTFVQAMNNANAHAHARARKPDTYSTSTSIQSATEIKPNVLPQTYQIPTSNAMLNQSNAIATMMRSNISPFSTFQSSINPYTNQVLLSPHAFTSGTMSPYATNQVMLSSQTLSGAGTINPYANQMHLLSPHSLASIHLKQPAHTQFNLQHQPQHQSHTALQTLQTLPQLHEFQSQTQQLQMMQQHTLVAASNPAAAAHYLPNLSMNAAANASLMHASIKRSYESAFSQDPNASIHNQKRPTSHLY